MIKEKDSPLNSLSNITNIAKTLRYRNNSQIDKKTSKILGESSRSFNQPVKRHNQISSQAQKNNESFFQAILPSEKNVIIPQIPNGYQEFINETPQQNHFSSNDQSYNEISNLKDLPTKFDSFEPKMAQVQARKIPSDYYRRRQTLQQKGI